MSGFKITNLKNLKAELQAKSGSSTTTSSSSASLPSDSQTSTSVSSVTVVDSRLPSVPFVSYLPHRTEPIALSLPSTAPSLLQQIEKSGFGVSLRQNTKEGRYLIAREKFFKHDIVLVEIPFAWFDYRKVHNDDHKLIDYLQCNPTIRKDELFHRFAQLEPVYSRYSSLLPTELHNNFSVSPLQLISGPIHMNAFQTCTYSIPESFHSQHSYNTLDNLRTFLRTFLTFPSSLASSPDSTGITVSSSSILPLQLCMSLSSMFNHSCIPNITYVSIILQSSSMPPSNPTVDPFSHSSTLRSSSLSDATPSAVVSESSEGVLHLPYNTPILIFYALQDIAKDDILYHSYIDPDAHVEDRQIRLTEGYAFTCQCPKCTLEKSH